MSDSRASSIDPATMPVIGKSTVASAGRSARAPSGSAWSVLRDLHALKVADARAARTLRQEGGRDSQGLQRRSEGQWTAVRSEHLVKIPTAVSSGVRTELPEFAPKMKTSPMAQFADFYLWPICMGGYNAENRSYKRPRGRQTDRICSGPRRLADACDKVLLFR